MKPAAPFALAFAAILSVAALSACGGGGGGGTAATAMAPSFRIDRGDARTLTGGTAPTETVRAQIARQPAMLTRMDSIVASRVYGNSDSSALPTFRITANCAGTSCTLREATSGISEALLLSDLESVSEGTRAVLSKNGVTLLEYAGANLRAYYSWLEHSAFAVRLQRGTVNVAGVGDVNHSLRYVMAGGDLTGSRPSVDATWTGVMVGTPATGTERGDYLQGDVSLTYESVTNTLDAVFTNIVNLNVGAAHSVPALAFGTVYVAADGTFASGVAGRLEGGLYGPSHAEATGVFEQSGVVGAFGAKKQP